MDGLKPEKESVHQQKHDELHEAENTCVLEGNLMNGGDLKSDQLSVVGSGQDLFLG